MPGITNHEDFEGDLQALSHKYVTIRKDIEYVTNYIRDGARMGYSCREFAPAFIIRVDVSISALGPKGQDRCSLICEKDRTDCYLLMAYDNDDNEWGDAIISKIGTRLGIT